MENQEFSENRRDFLTKVVPFATLLCLGCKSSTAQSLIQDTKSSGSEDQRIMLEKTYLYHYGTFIPILQALATEMGKEKFNTFLTRVTLENKKRMIASITKDMPEKNIKTLSSLFSNMLSSPPYNTAFTAKITEQTDTVLEVQYTECLAAKLLRSMDAADIGYVLHCSGTQAVGPAISPEIRVSNPKNLMRGDYICIERFTLDT